MIVDINDASSKAAIKVLTECILNSSYEQIIKEVKRNEDQDGNIYCQALRKTLMSLANITDMDASKVGIGRQNININQAFVPCLNQAL